MPVRRWSKATGGEWDWTMKIAFLVGEFPKLSQVFIINQITGLIDRGHEVHIYALEGPSREQKQHPQVAKYQLLERTYYAPKPPENYGLRFLQAIALLIRYSDRDPGLLGRSLNAARYGKSVLSLRLLYATMPFLGSRAYDIIHCQFGVYGLQGMMLQRIEALTGQLVCSFRGFDVSEYPRRCGQQVYQSLFATDMFALANCEFFRRRVIELGCHEERIVVHGSGIDCQKFALTLRQFPADGIIRIVTIGRLVEKKGIEYGIRALAQLAKAHPNVNYQIIGEGELRPHLQQLITDLGLRDRVQLLGSRRQAEIIEILNRSHLFIAPCVTSQTGDQDAPVNTLKEAMAMGLPVVSTRHGGIPELVEDGVSGFLVAERDADAIAAKLNYLMEHPEEWPKMGQAGRNRVEVQYNINTLNDELVEIYQSLCADSKTSKVSQVSI